MSGTETEEDPVAYARRLQAEIEAAARDRRRREPTLARLEREIERTWTAVAPPGAVGDRDELLLDRAERLAYVDVDVDVGDRRGISQVKRSIRKLVYWYLRYLADQLSVLHNVIVRLLRRMDTRIDAVENALALSDGRDWLPRRTPDLGREAIAATTREMGEVAGVVAVISCGDGALVAALADEGIAAYGVDADAERIAPGVASGVDLRPAEPIDHIASLPPATLGGVVLQGFVEDLALPALTRVVEAVTAALAPEARILIAVTDPADRTKVDGELLAGRGVSPETWAHLLERAGFESRTVSVTDDRVRRLVVARRS